jgi:hypothetical protein
MAASTGLNLFISDDRPKSTHQFFREAEKQLLEANCLLLTDVPENFALPLIESLNSDPAIGSEGKYRYGISYAEQLMPILKSIMQIQLRERETPRLLADSFT